MHKFYIIKDSIEYPLWYCNDPTSIWLDSYNDNGDIIGLHFSHEATRKLVSSGEIAEFMQFLYEKEAEIEALCFFSWCEDPQYWTLTKLKTLLESDLAPEDVKKQARKTLGILLQENKDGSNISPMLYSRIQSGYVYLIQADSQIGNGYYKIGRSKNLFDRIKTFEVKLPFEIKLIHQFEADDMIQAESDLHQRYSDCRVNGEWFDLEEGTVSEITEIESFNNGKFQMV